MTRFRLLAAALGLTLLAAGCSMPIAVSEVLQQPADAKLYTRSNLWFTDPASVSALNIQQGRILPAGSEVEAIFADDSTLVLRDEHDQIYTIKFDAGMHLCTMREYIRTLLTTTPPEEEFAFIRPEMRPHVRRGEVLLGMNRREVAVTYGTPVRSRTPAWGNESWIYWIAPDRTIRVVFRDDAVVNIINMQTQE